MHDTLKKPRELIMTAYVIRSPELAARSKVTGELDIDPAVSRIVYPYSYIRLTINLLFTRSSMLTVTEYSVLND